MNSYSATVATIWAVILIQVLINKGGGICYLCYSCYATCHPLCLRGGVVIRHIRKSVAIVAGVAGKGGFLRK